MGVGGCVGCLSFVCAHCSSGSPRPVVACKALQAIATLVVLYVLKYLHTSQRDRVTYEIRAIMHTTLVKYYELVASLL